MNAKKPKEKKVFSEKKFIKKEKKPTEVVSTEKEKPRKTYALLRGMHDALPKDEKYWRALSESAARLADYFMFERIETPTLEEAGLFVRSVGKGTDIVEKEMYVFEDRDGARVALRP